MISLEEFAIASMSWTKEELAKLWQLAVGEKGTYSTAIIAEMLNNEFHNCRSRNAVIGKLQRGGVKLGFKPAGEFLHSRQPRGGGFKSLTTSPRRVAKAKPKTVTVKSWSWERNGYQRTPMEKETDIPRLVDAPCDNLPLEGRCGAWEAICHLGPNHCRWPINEVDSDEFHYCCQPVMVNSSYCRYHKVQSTVDPRRLRSPVFYRY